MCRPFAMKSASDGLRPQTCWGVMAEPVSSADKKRVLIVDDEHIIADTLVTIFSAAGYESLRRAHLSYFRWAPHFAIVDVILPGMNSIDFAILLKAITPDCTVQLFSGQIDSIHLLEAARGRGHAFEVIAKPVHPTELLALASALFPSAACPIEARPEGL
jgi:DNA-binding NtrC family response regulator